MTSSNLLYKTNIYIYTEGYFLRKILIFLLVIFFELTAFAASTSNLNKDGVILDGFDPLTYFKSASPLKGNPKFQAKFNEDIYLFISEENKAAFLLDPKKYVPQFGGWCAYAVADSKSKVEIDPKSFLIQDGKLLVFYNGIWANTREKWQKTKNKDAKEFLKEAEANWNEVKSKDP